MPSLSRSLVGSRSLLTLALAVPLSAQSPAQSPTLPATIATLDSVMNAGLTRDRITGAAYVLVIDGRIAASRGFGVTDSRSRHRVHPDSTTFGLSSTTKLFTAIAAARLASEGRVSLDAPVEPYFRESPLGDRTRGVTLAMLLTHTAGYDDPTIGSAARTAADILPLDTYLQRSLSPPWIRPRSNASYSNIGVTLAGHTLSIASGMPFETLLDSTVFMPFGMASTSVRQPLPAHLERARASPGRVSGRRVAPVRRIFFNDRPSAAAYSTPHDMGVLMSRLLAPPTSEDSAVARILFTRRYRSHPALPGMTLGFMESTTGESVFEHGGDWEDYSNSLYLDRASSVGLFAVFSSGEGGRTGRELWAALRKALPRPPVQASADSTRRAAAVSGRCTDIAGSYRDMRMSVNSIAKLGVLTGDVREVKVADSPEGINVDGRVYRDLGRSVFRSDDGRTVAFRCEEGRPATHLFRGDQPTRTFQRLDAGETRGIMSLLLMLAFVGTVLSLVLDARPHRRSDKPRDIVDTIARIARILASAAAVFLFGAFAFFLVTADPWEFQYGLPRTIGQMLAFSPAVAALAVIAVIATLLAIVRAKASSGVLDAVRVAPVVLLVILMVQWNLVQIR